MVRYVLKRWQTFLHNGWANSCFSTHQYLWKKLLIMISIYLLNIYDKFDAFVTIWEKIWYLILIKMRIAGVTEQKKSSWILRLIVFVKYKDVSIKLNPKINRRSIFRWQFLYNKHFSFRSFQFSTIINLRKAALRTTRKVLNERGENLI